MNPFHLCPKSFSPAKLSQIRTHIASTQTIHQYRGGARKYSSDQPPENPPPEFPAAPQPDKPSESSEVPSAPDFDDGSSPPKTQNRVPVDDPYGSGAAIPQQRPKSKVRQPHGAEVKIPIPPESDDIRLYYL
ncbi:hypothetical protein HAX54_011400 [Datura stramonium]|uniref:Uncharacterized protein n=1 Tax=Datura stramonium TaxID=4076 RepID=A0ABS8TIS0_DATST|nr:hypothetical protein [Datura stramonium]